MGSLELQLLQVGAKRMANPTCKLMDPGDPASLPESVGIEVRKGCMDFFPVVLLVLPLHGFHFEGIILYTS